MNTPSYALTLGAAVEAIASGALDGQAYTRDLLARIAATDPNIQAWAWLDAERAQDAALNAAVALDIDGARALEGMPLGVKDIIATADQPTQLGSPIFAGARPPYDAQCVLRLANAGGFVLGKTVTTEFAFMHPGATRNPWNAAHTPGGSSSGSAAAVASGHAPAALGTQTNGSIIRPAAFCGIVGFKPTAGLLSFEGIAAFSPSLDTLGVFARSVDDCARVAAALAPAGALKPGAPAPAAPPRLARLRRYPWTSTSRDVDDALDAAAGTLRDAGAQVEDVELPAALRDTLLVHRTIMLREACLELGGLQRSERSRMSATLNEALDAGAAIGIAQYQDAIATRLGMVAAARAWLDGFDALLSPPAPDSAPADLTRTGDPSCCTLWSLLGFPALALPIGIASNGLPLGAQLGAAAGADDRLLAVGTWCETRFAFRGLV